MFAGLRYKGDGEDSNLELGAAPWSGFNEAKELTLFSLISFGFELLRH